MLCAVLSGCESLQRKLIRKPKNRPKPTPIIKFTDYTRTLTPLDRYRKHAVMFDYWNSELLKVFDETAPNQPVNQKRLRRMSAESLQELKTMRELLAEATAARLDPVVADREQLDQEIQTTIVGPSRLFALRQVVEGHTRDIHRDFFWRKVEHELKPADAPASP